MRLVRNEPSLDPPVRKAALELLEAYGEPIVIPAVWNTVKSAGADEQAYRDALDLARRLGAVEPSNGEVLNALGGAQYRVGGFTEAIATLTRCQETRDCPSEVNTAFLAMAHSRLGHATEARGLLEQIRGMLRGPRQISDPELRSLLAEAESVVTGDLQR
jgi:tetratricopeptide (TPR) repeat protein